MRFAGPMVDMDPRDLPYLPLLRYAGSVAQEQPEIVERIKATVLPDVYGQPESSSQPAAQG